MGRTANEFKKLPKDIAEVRVIWDDAWGDDAAMSGDDDYPQKPCIMRDTGFLVSKGARVVIARQAMIHASGRITYRDFCSIPKGMVKAIIPLGPA